MEIRVENIQNGTRGSACFENNHIIVTTAIARNKVYYDSIQVFANHWRFIEDKPKELLKPCVIIFIRHYLILNDIKLNQVESITFEKYNGWCECEISGSFYSVANTFELKDGLIDFDLIDDSEPYTLEQLGIK